MCRVSQTKPDEFAIRLLMLNAHLEREDAVRMWHSEELLDACDAALLTLNINRKYVACPELEAKLRVAIAKAKDK